MRRIAHCLVLLICLAGARAEAQQWAEVRSPHFSVFTDGGEAKGRQVAERFEQMRAAFGVLFSRLKVNIPVPLQIVAFRNQKEFRGFAPLWKGKPLELAGFFQGAEDRDFIALDLSSPAGWDVVFHEYAHLLINGNLPPMPVWYDEGFAEYCSSLKVDKKEIEFGLVPERLPPVLRENSWMKLVDLFSVEHNSPAYNEKERRGVFYAQSWITVHYMMAQHKMKELAVYMQLTQEKKMPIADAIRQAFALEPKQLEDAVRNYFGSGHARYFRALAPADLALGPYEVRKLDETEWQSVQADLHYHSADHRDQGVAEFRDILKRQPDNAAANRGLGYVYLRQNDFDQAAEHFARAAAGNSQDSRVHYFTALLMNRKAMTTGRPPDDVATMKNELQSAIALDPNYADAFNLLAYAESAAGNLEAARAAVKKAVELNPRNEFYLVNQAEYELQAQAWDAAEQIWNHLKQSDNPQIAQMAQRNLEQLSAMRHPAVPMSTTSSKDLTLPQWKPTEGKPGDSKAVDKENGDVAPPPEMRSIRFLKGKLLSVDCSAKPGAVLKIVAGKQTMQMFTQDTSALLLIGVDTFSCAWTDRKVSVNYRLKEDGRGELVSLEVD
jgi:tetratricopeptide (TPR) repeat protein